MGFARGKGGLELFDSAMDAWEGCWEWRLRSVVWRCGGCHGLVHGVGGDEVLVREWWSVRLLGCWWGGRMCGGGKGWVGRVRWKSR